MERGKIFILDVDSGSEDWILKYRLWKYNSKKYRNTLTIVRQENTQKLVTTVVLLSPHHPMCVPCMSQISHVRTFYLV